MAQVTLAGVDGEAPPPLCSCCPVGVEQASLNRLGRVESFLSQSQIPFCREVTPPKKPPLLYANPTAGASDVKAAAKAAIDEAKDELERLSSEIWTHPCARSCPALAVSACVRPSEVVGGGVGRELNFEEEYCHGLLTEYLEGLEGVTVERSYKDLPTAFRATVGSVSAHLRPTAASHRT